MKNNADALIVSQTSLLPICAKASQMGLDATIEIAYAAALAVFSIAQFLRYALEWRIFMDINFYDSEAHAGSSYWPFLGFMVFLIGLAVTFIGIVKIVNAKHQFNLFYDQRDKKNLEEPKYVRDKKIGIILTVVGIVMMVASFFIERL